MSIKLTDKDRAELRAAAARERAKRSAEYQKRKARKSERKTKRKVQIKYIELHGHVFKV